MVDYAPDDVYFICVKLLDLIFCISSQIHQLLQLKGLVNVLVDKWYTPFGTIVSFVNELNPGLYRYRKHYLRLMWVRSWKFFTFFYLLSGSSSTAWPKNWALFNTFNRKIVGLSRLSSYLTSSLDIHLFSSVSKGTLWGLNFSFILTIWDFTWILSNFVIPNLVVRVISGVDRSAFIARLFRIFIFYFTFCVVFPSIAFPSAFKFSCAPTFIFVIFFSIYFCWCPFIKPFATLISSFLSLIIDLWGRQVIIL